MWQVHADQPTETDVLLAQALTAYEQSLCAGCGEPKHLAWNPDMGGWYEVDCETTCAGCAALEEQRKQDRENKVVHDPGMKMRLRNTLPEGAQLAPWTPGQQS